MGVFREKHFPVPRLLPHTHTHTHTNSTEQGLNTDLHSKTRLQAPEKSHGLGHWVVGLPVTALGYYMLLLHGAESFLRS